MKYKSRTTVHEFDKTVRILASDPIDKLFVVSRVVGVVGGSNGRLVGVGQLASSFKHQEQ